MPSARTSASESPSKREKELEAKTKELEAKLVKKDHVIAEVAAELVATNKSLGSVSAIRSTCGLQF